MNSSQLDQIIKKIVDRKKAEMLNASVRDIAELVFKETGDYKPSTSVVADALRRIGAKAQGRRWVLK